MTSSLAFLTPKTFSLSPKLIFLNSLGNQPFSADTTICRQSVPFICFSHENIKTFSLKSKIWTILKKFLITAMTVLNAQIAQNSKSDLQIWQQIYLCNIYLGFRRIVLYGCLAHSVLIQFSLPCIKICQRALYGSEYVPCMYLLLQ